MHAGYIAHFDIHGFRATYASKLAELIRGEMYALTAETCWREASERYLYQSVYTDGMTAGDVMIGICAVARELAPMVADRESEVQDAAKVEAMRGLAARHGFAVTRED